jgi:hypothetical protein
VKFAKKNNVGAILARCEDEMVMIGIVMRTFIIGKRL